VEPILEELMTLEPACLKPCECVRRCFDSWATELVGAFYRKNSELVRVEFVNWVW
jgi:hypothetical protein